MLFLRHEDGQTLSEYAIVVSVMTVLGLAFLTALGPQIVALYNRAMASLLALFA